MSLFQSNNLIVLMMLGLPKEMQIPLSPSKIRCLVNPRSRSKFVVSPSNKHSRISPSITSAPCREVAMFSSGTEADLNTVSNKSWKQDFLHYGNLSKQE